MANLQDIKRRIGSVTSTQKITRAMKMVAAAKLRRAQESIEMARPYALRMRDLVNNLARRADLEGHPLLHGSGNSGRIDLIVVTSDRGLCGAFNSSIVNAALRHLEDTFPGKQVEMTVVGKKGTELLSRKYDGIAQTHTDIFNGPIMDTATAIIDTAAREFMDDKTEAVYVLYNAFQSAITQNVTLEKLLPFEPEAVDQASSGSDADFIYEPSEAGVFEALLSRHLSVQMHRVLNESAASEHGARMTAMDSATTNAGDMIDRMTLQYNRARQDAITTELIEVVSGAEAL
jgi:F-type H+-transporting ATPase subunit gamma